INLTGIGSGPNESQNLAITAVSSNPGLIPNPTVNYASPNTAGVLTYTPVANASGTAAIVVTGIDDGGTANGGVNPFSQTFTVVVNPVNQAPTLNQISPATFTFNENDSGTQQVTLTGIGPGAGETGQTLTVTAVSSNPTVVPNPVVTYTSP